MILYLTQWLDRNNIISVSYFIYANLDKKYFYTQIINIKFFFE